MNCCVPVCIIMIACIIWRVGVGRFWFCDVCCCTAVVSPNALAPWRSVFAVGCCCYYHNSLVRRMRPVLSRPGTSSFFFVLV